MTPTEQLATGRIAADHPIRCLACDRPLTPLWVARDWLDPARGHLCYQCPSCGLLRIPSAEADQASPAGEAATRYSDDEGEWSGRLHRRLQSWLLGPETGLVANWLPPDSECRVLEVGCGSGLLATALWRRRPDLTILGVEPRPDAARLAAAAGVKVVAATLEEADLPLGSLDAVILVHVIEHLPDPVAVFRRAAALLKPQGVLVVSVPAADSWEARLFGAQWYHLAAPSHLWIPTRASLRLLAARAGLRVEALSSHSYRMPLVGFPASLFPALEPSGLRRLARRRPLLALAAQALFGLAFVCLAPVTFLANFANRGSSVSLVARRASAL